MQNPLMLRPLLIGLLVLSANLVAAQQQAATPQESKITASPGGVLPSDAAKVSAAISGSYYHPDGMSGLDCTVLVDWAAFFSALKASPAADRLKLLRGLKIRSHAIRDKKTEITFDWAAGSLDTKDQIEDGLKQTLGGFYEMYWPMFASSPISNGDVSKIEPQAGGGVKVSTSSGGISVVVLADREDIPTHYTIDSPAMNGTMDVHYVPSPNPAPGDLRRISGMDLSEHIGNSIMNIKLSLDYQAVDGFYIPEHVSYEVGGAYSLSVDFSNCSVSKGAVANSVK